MLGKPDCLIINNIKISFAKYSDRIILIENITKKRGKHPITIGYCNANTIRLTAGSDYVNNIIKKNTVNFADGIGVRLAFQILNWGYHIDSQNATDFNFTFLQYANDNKMRIFLLGSTDINLDKICKKINIDYPNINIVGMLNGYTEVDNSIVVEFIRKSNAEVLMVGMGQPKQELYISSMLEKINVSIIIYVGGFIDYYSGGKKRAPKIFRRISMEWLFRLIMEPRRLWKRYIIGIPHFFWIIAKEKYRQ